MYERVLKTSFSSFKLKPFSWSSLIDKSLPNRSSFFAPQSVEGQFCGAYSIRCFYSPQSRRVRKGNAEVFSLLQVRLAWVAFSAGSSFRRFVPLRYIHCWLFLHTFYLPRSRRVRKGNAEVFSLRQVRLALAAFSAGSSLRRFASLRCVFYNFLSASFAPLRCIAQKSQYLSFHLLCLILPLLICSLFFSHRLNAQNQDNLRNHVETLASPVMQGRLTGSLGQKLAAIYIQNQFDSVLVDPFEVKKIQHGGWLDSSQDTLYYKKDFFYSGINRRIHGEILLDSIFTVHCSAEDLFDLRAQNQHKNTIFIISDWGDFLELFGHEFTLEEIFLTDDYQYENWHLFVKKESWKDFQSINYYLIEQEQTWFTENLVVPVYHHPKNSKTWIFSAHYDHLGTTDSLFFPGADDNASGVALLIELAKLLQNSAFHFPANITFVFFSAEEQGLLGSCYFVEHSSYFNSTIERCLNFDMVGFVKDKRIQIIHYLDTFDFSLVSPSEIEIEFIPQEAFLHEFSSDHLSFVEQGIPALNFFTGLHTYYHTPQDTAEKLNHDAMNALLHALFDALKKME